MNQYLKIYRYGFLYGFPAGQFLLQANGKTRYPLQDNGFLWSCYPDLNWGPHPYQNAPVYVTVYPFIPSCPVFSLCYKDFLLFQFISSRQISPQFNRLLEDLLENLSTSFFPIPVYRGLANRQGSIFCFYTFNSRPQKIPPRKFRSGVTVCSELVAGVDVGLGFLGISPVIHISILFPPDTICVIIAIYIHIRISSGRPEIGDKHYMIIPRFATL